jgi:hypothetical protein
VSERRTHSANLSIPPGQQLVDSQAWLTDVLSRIADHKINRIDELLPWRHAQANEVVPGAWTLTRLLIGWEQKLEREFTRPVWCTTGLFRVGISFEPDVDRLVGDLEDPAGASAYGNGPFIA